MEFSSRPELAYWPSLQQVEVDQPVRLAFVVAAILIGAWGGLALLSGRSAATATSGTTFTAPAR